ncbi:TraK family protein [Thalassospira tepidiphila]|uniref:TraK family protein n=1 Tax=Thalassospira tepidiphila TaxID=393657 RepID=UPI001BCE2F68|nr:TraK family protein [Thalassospira tepidiphila]
MAGIWGQARIELLALQDEILAELEKGVSARQIFDQLFSDGRITISRRSFYRRVKLLRAEHTAPKGRVPAKTRRQSSATTPTLPPSNTEATSFLPTLKAKEQAALDRLWGGDDPEDDASDETEASQ